jgi:hypothetical protein
MSKVMRDLSWSRYVAQGCFSFAQGYRKLTTS